MVANEVCRKYDAAADKAEMIQVLADVNECTKQDIIELLETNGRVVPASRKRGPKKKAPKFVNGPMPDVVREALAEKMDKIDQRIKELEPVKNEYDRLVEQYELLAQYLCS
jgi:hypothetical protein